MGRRGSRRKYQGTFVEADVCTYNPPADQHFEFVLVNSLLHHLRDEETARILSTLRRVIQKEGCIHILVIWYWPTTAESRDG